MKKKHITALAVSLSLSGCDFAVQESNNTTVPSSGLTQGIQINSSGGLNYLWKLDALDSYPYLNKFLVGDFNGDKKSDLFYAGAKMIGVRINTGSGFATSLSAYTSTPSNNFSWNLGDFNGDGKTDVVVQPSTGGTYVYLSNGSDFTLAWAQAWPSSGDKILVGDYNGDGKDDIFIQSIGSGWSGYKVMLNTGSSFVTGWSGSWPSWGERVISGKFDGISKPSALLVTADRGQGVTWVGWKLMRVSGASFYVAEEGSWPSWGERIHAGRIFPNGPQQILVNADLRFTNWNGFKLMNWTGYSFIESYTAAWPSSRERLQFGDYSGNGIMGLFVSPDDANSGMSIKREATRVYSFPLIP